MGVWGQGGWGPGVKGRPRLDSPVHELAEVRRRRSDDFVRDGRGGEVGYLYLLGTVCQLLTALNE